MYKLQESLHRVLSSDAQLNFSISKWCFKFIALVTASSCLNLVTTLVINPSPISVDFFTQQLGNLYFATSLATWYASTRLLKAVIAKITAELVIFKMY
jgi:hypothetical protein